MYCWYSVGAVNLYLPTTTMRLLIYCSKKHVCRDSVLTLYGCCVLYGRTFGIAEMVYIPRLDVLNLTYDKVVQRDNRA